MHAKILRWPLHSTCCRKSLLLSLARRCLCRMLQKLMLGTPEDGLVTEEEAHLMFKQIDTNNGGTIDYREVAQLLSQPGWDARLVGRMSNVLL